MTTIRNICCNDFLEITSMSMDHLTILGKEGIGLLPLKSSLEHMAEFPNYFLVAVSLGNRIKGYSTAIIQQNKNQKHCEISETNCQTFDLVAMFIKRIEETADKIDKLNHLETWMPSNSSEQSINFFERLGFTYEGKKVDGKAGSMTSYKVLKKDLSGNRTTTARS